MEPSEIENTIPRLTAAEFENSFQQLARLAHATSVNHGFWSDRGAPEQMPMETTLCKVGRIGLMHEELSEAVQGIRKDLMDDKLPHRKMVAVELADCIIRIMDFAAGYNLDVAACLVEKMAYNTTRPFMHGDKKA